MVLILSEKGDIATNRVIDWLKILDLLSPLLSPLPLRQYLFFIKIW